VRTDDHRARDCLLRACARAWRCGLHDSDCSPAVSRCAVRINVVTRHVYLPPDMWPGLSEPRLGDQGHEAQNTAPPSCRLKLRRLKLHDGTDDFSLEAVLGLKPVS